MEVKINREIRNYTESMFFGLSLRQFIFSVLALSLIHICTVSDRQRKPSVKAKLDRYKAQSKQQKEAERKEPEVSKPEVKNAPAQTVHQQPKPKNKNVKER